MMDKCPFSAGITVRFDNAPAVRFQQESMSAFDRNCCPHSAGIGVRFAQELVSGFSKNMHQCPFIKFLYRDKYPATYKLCTAIAPARNKICTMTAKSAPYPPCTVIIIRLKFLDTARCFRRVTQPPHIAGPLAKIFQTHGLSPCAVFKMFRLDKIVSALLPGPAIARQTIGSPAFIHKHLLFN